MVKDLRNLEISKERKIHSSAISFKEHVKYLRNISLVYVNIPFCKSKCHFCCFSTPFGSDLLLIKKLKNSYIKALKKELAVKSLYFTTKHTVDLKAINFGGGTPTLLTVEELHEILSLILKFFNQKIGKIKDISIEATPDSLSPAKLKGLMSIGFNRISIGAQTFNQQILARLNRRHSVKQFYTSYDWIRSAGFKNVNIDLLYGIPFQSFIDFKKDLETAVSLNPEHISPSPLLPPKRFLFSIERKNMEKNIERNIRWARFSHKFIEENGYNNYFHKYFSKKGKESVTELIYFFNIPYIGVGAGAASWVGVNPSNIKSYIADSYSDTLFDKDTFDNPLIGIRRLILFPEGICIPYFNKRYNCNIEKLLKTPRLALDFCKNLEGIRKKKQVKETEEQNIKILEEWKKKGIIEKRANYIRIAPKKRFSKEAWELYTYSI